jgi:flagellar biosynthesis/type III secretory pathway protein FliH
LIPLPDDLKLQFRIELQQRLPDKTMPHITLFEELALKEGLEKGLEKGIQKGLLEGRQEGLEKGILQTAREAIIDVLDTRFDHVPESLRERVSAIGSETTLRELLRRAVRTPSLEEFQAAL